MSEPIYIAQEVKRISNYLEKISLALERLVQAQEARADA